MKKLLVILLILMTLAVPAYAAFELPEGLQSIGREAFANTVSLTDTVTIPEGVTYIGEYAFTGCTGVTEFVLPDTVTEIREGAFSGCTSVEMLVIPETVTTIGSNAFADCGSLAELVLPESVTSVGEGAFSGCEELKVTILGDASVIPEDVLADCGEVIVLEIAPVEDFTYTVTAEGTVTITGYTGSAEVVAVPEMIEGCPVTEIGSRAFISNKTITIIGLPQTVVGIGENAFFGSALQRVYGTEQVENFGDFAFCQCTQLASIPLGDNIRTMGAQVFQNCPVEAVVYVPYEHFDGISGVANSSSNVKIIFYEVIDNNEVTIVDSYVSGDVVIPEMLAGYPVTVIGEKAFEAQWELTSISLPETVTRIEAYAFYWCEKIQSIHGMKNVEYYGESAFNGCTALKAMSFGSDVMEELITICCDDVIVESGVFDGAGCTCVFYSITEDNEVTIARGFAASGDLVLPETIAGYPVTVIGDQAFYSYNNDLTDVVIPDTVTHIGEQAFSICPKLVSVVLPESLVSLGDSAFSYCALTSIELPAKLAELGPYCFYGNPLTEITIPESVKVIGQAALADTNLTSLIIPDTVEEIGDYMATGCEYLTEVRLPSHLTYVGTCAFNGCTALETLHLPDTVTTFGMAVFGNTPSLREVNIPASLTQTLGCTFRDSGIITRAVDALVAEIITDDMTDFEKALALHDYIINHAEYDLSAPCFHGAEGVLLYGRGVCDSYAEAYYALLNKVGIENHIIYGTAGGGSHAWNLVKLDEEWYFIDCTWDDPLPNGNENHQYFGLTDELLRKTHTWEQTSDMPAATGTRYQYGVDNGKLE